MEKEKTVYSYHNFYFPFRWNKEDMKCMGVKFAELFDNGSAENNWKRKKINYDTGFNEKVDYNQFREYFDRYQYFEESARLFTCYSDETDLARRYELRLDKYENLQYEISACDKTFSLNIDEVELIIYSTDVAILSLKASYCPKNQADRCISNVKFINEFGRRVGLSFWPKEGVDAKKYPDRLRLVYGDGEILSSDELSGFVRQASNDICKSDVRLLYVTKLLRTLLNLCNYTAPEHLQHKSSDKIIFRAKETDAENEIHIHPILNEKMYVTCCVIDKDYTDWLSVAFRDDEEVFEEKESKSFSELLTVDLEGKSSYKGKLARDNYVREHTYFRDIKEECSIVSGVTDQIYVQVMADYNYATEYHRNIYSEIILLGLIQKMSIAEFQTEITAASKEIAGDKKKLNNRYISQIIDLQKRYVAFQNQYLLYEITFRSEGRYLYAKIQDELGVIEENGALTETLNNIYSLVDAHQGFSFNKWALVISLIALLTSLVQTIGSAYAFNEIDFLDPIGILTLIIDAVAILVCVYVILKVKYKR